MPLRTDHVTESSWSSPGAHATPLGKERLSFYLRERARLTQRQQDARKPNSSPFSIWTIVHKLCAAAACCLAFCSQLSATFFLHAINSALIAVMAFFRKIRESMSRVNAPLVVTIAEPETISPIIEAHSKDFDDDDVFQLERTPSKQQHRVKIGKRLSGRPLVDRNASSNPSLAESALSSILAEDSANSSHRHHGHHAHDVVAQVSAWLKQEKARRAARRAAKRAPKPDSSGSSVQTKVSTETSSDTKVDGLAEGERRRPSDASDGSAALDTLEQIIERSLSAVSHESRRMPHRIGRKLRRQSTAGSSDTEYQDGDVLVPSCDVVLDNTRTLAYSGGGVDEDDNDDMTPGTRKSKEKQAWATFKYEIVRLSHTLRLKGWRRIPMDRSSDIEVERLSGALTNAVYVVSPPKDLPPKDGEDGAVRPRNPPP